MSISGKITRITAARGAARQRESERNLSSAVCTYRRRRKIGCPRTVYDAEYTRIYKGREKVVSAFPCVISCRPRLPSFSLYIPNWRYSRRHDMSLQCHALSFSLASWKNVSFPIYFSPIQEMHELVFDDLSGIEFQNFHCGECMRIMRIRTTFARA